MRPDHAGHGRAEGISTRAVHAGSAPASPGAPVVTPVAETTTFFTDAVPTGEVLYTRYATNPNHRALGEKLAALEGAEAALVLGSGMAAIAMGLLAFAGAGGHVVAAAELYGGAMDLLRRELPELGICTTFVGEGEWEAAIGPDTRALYVEVPVNPTLTVPDFPAIAEVARRRGLPLLVDATFATPVNFRPLEHGATMVLHSATKYLSGHTDVTAGVAAGTAADVERVRHKLKSFGPVLDPLATWLLDRGVKTLAVRVERQNGSALALARWLEEQPQVSRVLYPGLPSHPSHERARALFDGFGGMLSIVVRGGDEAALRVLQRFRLFRVAPSLGGVESLASVPRFTSHAALTPAQREQIGIANGFVRLSVGIEDAEDLRADLEQALAPEGG